MKTKLKYTIALTASYYGRDLADEVLTMYAEDLSDLDPAACIAAYQNWRRNPKHSRMPFPAEIREIIAPSENPQEEAREAASRIIGAVPKFGWCNPQEARDHIGELGWQVVEMQGGWTAVCEGMNARQTPNLQAQYRDLAESIYRKSQRGIFGAPPSLPPGPRGDGGLARIGDVMGILGGKGSDE